MIEINHRPRWGVLLAITISVAGCNGDADIAEQRPAPPTGTATPAPAPPARPGAGAGDAAPAGDMASGGSTTQFLGLTATIPEGWQQRPVNMPMRTAAFTARSADPGDLAEVVIFHFGVDQGGGVEENIARWEGQFRTPEGATPEAQVERIEVDGMPVTIVELEGAYQGMSDPGFRPGRGFLAAIVEAPAGMIFVRLVGAAEDVAENAPAFREFIDSIRQDDGEAGA